MISLQVDMVQYDCPYIDTTVANDVSFYVKQWDFNPATELLETRVLVKGEDEAALDAGLSTLGTHENTHEHDLLKRDGDVALLRSHIDQTDAMQVIRDHDGYITGPFEIDAGSETWHVGFDRPEIADGALSELSRNNEYTVEFRDSQDLEDYYDLVSNVDAARSLLDGCRDLSTVERETIETAVESGYFTTPRDATLSALADQMDVSKTAVSKNLRRGQRKLLDRVVDAMADIGANATAAPDE